MHVKSDPGFLFRAIEITEGSKKKHLFLDDK